MPRVLWIGVGRFGLPMANRCMDLGLTLDVLGTRGRGLRGASQLGSRGAHMVGPDQAGDYGILVACLPRASDVVAVLDDLPAIPPLVIDLTTGDPDTSRACADRGLSTGFRYADSPVSGSSQAAADGALTAFVGAEQGECEQLDAVVGALAANPFYFGSPGRGQVAKLVNQLMHITSMAVIGEGLALAAAEGLDLPSLLRALRTSSANSVMLERFGASIVAADFHPRFAADLAAKDLDAVHCLAGRHGLDLPLQERSRSLLHALLERGLGAGDFSRIAQIPGT